MILGRECVMDLHVTDDQIGRYFRRRQLGLRLLAHGARTQTVQAWSGLTRDQLVTLRRRWAITARDRRRGPSPSSFDVFFRSSRACNRAALLAGLFHIVGAVSSKRGRNAVERLPSVENGELLCETFELLREWEPSADIDLEQAVLLAVGVVEERAVELRYCARCTAVMLIDKLEPSVDTCGHCRRRTRSRPRATARGLDNGAQPSDESDAREGDVISFDHGGSTDG
jgi:hypothetical protein